MTRQLLELIQGLFIGSGGILPGISGAALAVVFGYYQAITELVAHPKRNAREFITRHWGLAVGIVLGFVVTTLLLDKIFSEHERAVIYLFWGFIAGTLPTIWRDARKSGAGLKEAIAFAVTAGIMVAFAVMGHGSGETLARAGTDAASGGGDLARLPGVWVLAGAIVGAGSLLPGVSASVILVYLGIYGPMLDAASSLSVPILAEIGVGALAALALLSRGIGALYRRLPGVMAALVLGFTLGSLILVFPGIPAADALTSAFVPLLAGLALSLALGRVPS
jgi:putative membrane protein